MIASHSKCKLTLSIAFFFVAITAVALVDAKKPSKNPPKSGGSGGGGSGGGGGKKDVPSVTYGPLACTSGRDRCLHTWESMFLGVNPVVGIAACDGSPIQPIAGTFTSVCQLYTNQTDVMVLDCGNTGSQQNTVEITYDGKQSKAQTTGSARAIFASSPPSKSSLKSGTVTSDDPNVDIWAYCYDENPLLLLPANGKFLNASLSCPDGQSRCLSMWEGNFLQIHPVQGAIVCADVPPVKNTFQNVCSFAADQASRFPVACNQRANDIIDISYDERGNGKAVSSGLAKAFFSQVVPKLSDLRSGTVTSSVLRENLYMYCP